MENLTVEGVCMGTMQREEVKPLAMSAIGGYLRLREIDFGHSVCLWKHVQ